MYSTTCLTMFLSSLHCKLQEELSGLALLCDPHFVDHALCQVELVVNEFHLSVACDEV